MKLQKEENSKEEELYLVFSEDVQKDMFETINLKMESCLFEPDVVISLVIMSLLSVLFKMIITTSEDKSREAIISFLKNAIEAKLPSQESIDKYIKFHDSEQE